MNEMKFITINKNRGWRGLAEIDILNEKHDLITKHIFSFSQPMWEDLIKDNRVVIADDKYYYIITFDKWLSGKLPMPEQQRSVLIKNFQSNIISVNRYTKDTWQSADPVDWNTIRHFIHNNNNHTTSDWNCIGIRVIPEI